MCLHGAAAERRATIRDRPGTICREWETNDEDFRIISAYEHAGAFGLEFIRGVRYRVLITPSETGFEVRFTVVNLSGSGRRDPAHGLK